MGNKIFIWGLFVLPFIAVSCGDFQESSYIKAVSDGRTNYVNENFAASEKSFITALNWAEERNDKIKIVIVLGELGRTYDAGGKIAEAEKVLLRRRTLAVDDRLDAETQIETFVALGIFYAKNRKCDEAATTFRELQLTTLSQSAPEEYADGKALISELLQLYCSP